MAGEARLIDGIQKNISAVVGNSGEGVERWKNTPELDAWVTFESWHYRLKEETELVRLPGSQRVYRGTPVALTTFSDEKELAREFIRYLKSTEGEAIFVKWGWSKRADRQRFGGN